MLNLTSHVLRMDVVLLWLCRSCCFVVRFSVVTLRAPACLCARASCVCVSGMLPFLGIATTAIAANAATANASKVATTTASAEVASALATKRVGC